MVDDCWGFLFSNKTNHNFSSDLENREFANLDFELNSNLFFFVKRKGLVFHFAGRIEVESTKWVGFWGGVLGAESRNFPP